VPKRPRDLFDIFPDLPWPQIRHQERRAAIEQQVRDVAVKWRLARERVSVLTARRDLAIERARALGERRRRRRLLLPVDVAGQRDRRMIR